MQSPYESSLVDAVLAVSLRRALSIELLQVADTPYVSEALALQYLKRRLRPSLFPTGGSMLMVAGFRFAVLLCSRVLADPLHVHSGGVRRDVEGVITWVTESAERLHRPDIEE
jgi:hypothetical protein